MDAYRVGQGQAHSSTSRGIGHATALALARAGAHVVAVARTVGGLEELDDAIKALGGSATLVPLDLKDYQGIDRLGPALPRWIGLRPPARVRKTELMATDAGHAPTLIDATAWSSFSASSLMGAQAARRWSERHCRPRTPVR